MGSIELGRSVPSWRRRASAGVWARRWPGRLQSLVAAAVLTTAGLLGGAARVAEAATPSVIYGGSFAGPIGTTPASTGAFIDVPTGAASESRTVVATVNVYGPALNVVTCELRRATNGTVLDSTGQVFMAGGVTRSTLTLLAAETIPALSLYRYEVYCSALATGSSATFVSLEAIKTLKGAATAQALVRSTSDVMLTTGSSAAQVPVVSWLTPSVKAKYLTIVRVEAELVSGTGTDVTCRSGVSSNPTDRTTYLEQQPVELHVGTASLHASAAGFGVFDNSKGGAGSQTVYCEAPAGGGTVIRIKAGAELLARQVTTVAAVLGGCGSTADSTASLIILEQSGHSSCPMASITNVGGALLPSGNWAVLGALPSVKSATSQDLTCGMWTHGSYGANGLGHGERITSTGGTWGAHTMVSVASVKAAEAPVLVESHCTGGTSASTLEHSSVIFLKV